MRIILEWTTGDMSIEPDLLVIIIVASLLGGALLIYAATKKPEWKKPIVYALTGILCFELAQQIFKLLYG